MNKDGFLEVFNFSCNEEQCLTLTDFNANLNREERIQVVVNKPSQTNGGYEM